MKERDNINATLRFSNVLVNVPLSCGIWSKKHIKIQHVSENVFGNIFDRNIVVRRHIPQQQPQTK